MSNNVNDEVIEDSPEVAVQKAYDESVVSNWTIARHSAALSMGCDILSGVFGPEIKGLQATGSYPNSLRDVVIVLWLCNLDPAQVVQINARLNIDQAVASAYGWAEIEGIKYGSAKYLEGVRTLTKIVGGIFTSFHAIESNGKTEPLRKNDTRQVGRSSLPITRSRRPAKALATS